MRWTSLTFALVLPILGGCGGDSLPPETDPGKGREALKTVLDSWVKGGTPEDLKNANSPIVAYDPDWVAGHKLTKYEIGPTDGRVGVDLLLNVKLFLVSSDGRPREKTVNFSVAIGSQTVVLRQT
jgi:hypothetical protein